jgi:hypothetical protein
LSYSQVVEEPHNYVEKEITRGKAKVNPEPILEHIYPNSSPIPLEEDQLMKDGGDMEMVLDEKELA